MQDYALTVGSTVVIHSGYTNKQIDTGTVLRVLTRWVVIQASHWTAPVRFRTCAPLKGHRITGGLAEHLNEYIRVPAAEVAPAALQDDAEPAAGLQPIPAFRPDAYDPAFYASNPGHLKPGLYLFGTLADGRPAYQFSSARTTPEAAAALFEALWPGTIWSQFLAADNNTQLPPDVCEAMATVDISWRNRPTSDAAPALPHADTATDKPNGPAAIPLGEASTPIASEPGPTPAP